MQTITMNVLKLANPELHSIFLRKLELETARRYRERRPLSVSARKRQRIYKRNWIRRWRALR
jgi:hypothetical protein